ncbi:hypothetical protein [Paenibacillus macquariensis]|uniref:Gas vesicle protein n=1 Tax=Paenibacillus macquariensis TaxID=948756 RepID=A0ABY1JL94_9BACL|nr:hypothetical protein [Paenibacillus macquariensis]MEC0090110.1 hypothetical protein [Paenibacillus macquariensis]OAB31013.1 hypothetical protein PMSM_19990 [Paenibacillus macquariensis subsp. macquariensis]SIQ37853.1 hypothetical protein SAMN05421578_101497 [Paenibacillus macquariensis]
MSDETEIVSEGIDPFLKDEILIWLVENSNQINSRLGITLLVGGSVVTGILISGKSYINGVVSELYEVGETTIASYYREFGVEVYGDSSSEDEQITPEMIHLKDAQILDGAVVRDVGWWRGKISSVDGYSIGGNRNN